MMQDEPNRKLSAPVSSHVIMLALVIAMVFGTFLGYRIGTASGTAGAWNQVKGLASAPAQAAPEQGAYSRKAIADCLDGDSRDPDVNCEEVLASTPEPKTSHDFRIAAVQTIDTSCPSPTTRMGDKCVLTSDVVLTEALWLSSGTTLDCQGYRMTPSVDGQDAEWQANRLGRNSWSSSVPSVPSTAVLLAGDTSGATLKNCVIENFDFGVVIANSKVPPAAKTASRNLITGNTLNNRYSGVEIIASDRNDIVDNTIHSIAPHSTGVFIMHDADDNLVKGNTYVGSSYMYWNPGPIFPGDTDEYMFGGEGMIVKGPVFSYNFKVGNRTFVGTKTTTGWAERNVIEGNDVDIPSHWGTGIMSTQATDGTVIRGNTVRRVGTALRAVGCCDRNASGSKNVIIEKNTVLGPAEDGIYVATTDDVIVRNNKVSNAWGVGIRVIYQALTTATVTKNLVTDSQIALELYTSPPNDPFNAKIFHNDFLGQTLGVIAELGAPVDLSFEGKGNYWGHSDPPAFRATDANDPSLVTDSHASLVPVSGLLDD